MRAVVPADLVAEAVEAERAAQLMAAKVRTLHRMPCRFTSLRGIWKREARRRKLRPAAARQDAADAVVEAAALELQERAVAVVDKVVAADEAERERRVRRRAS
jgi:hypothetical protein